MASLGRRLASVDAMPVALVAALAAVAAFAAAFLIGLGTAPTHESMNRAEREPASAPPAVLPILGRAAALPAAPPAREVVRRRVPHRRPTHPARRRTPPTPLPKLLSGTG